MRNIAKCKKCGDIIESMHPTDLVYCKCGEIGVDGGMALKCEANDWSNFLRVDDLGNEIKVKIQIQKMPEEKYNGVESYGKASRNEILGMLDEMIKTYVNLPEQAMSMPVNHYDLLNALMLIHAVMNEEYDS